MTPRQTIPSFLNRLPLFNPPAIQSVTFGESAVPGQQNEVSKSAEDGDTTLPDVINTKAASNSPGPVLKESPLPLISNASIWNLPKPFSLRDLLGSLVLFGIALVIWYVGDFHTFHNTDDVIHTLNSLYQWTPLSWESDHIGSFLSLLVSFIHRPYTNLLAISTLSSLLFLGGLALWASLLASRNTSLIESTVWVLLLLPLVMAKRPIFDNASHSSTFGSAFFFSGVFVRVLVNYLQNERRVRSLFVLFCCGFLTTYLTKNELIPLGIVSLCLIAQEAWMKPQRHSTSSILVLTAPALCLALALLLYEGLESTVPVANIYGMSLSNIPVSLPALFTNWSAKELTSPALIAVPVLLLIFRPANRLLNFLTAGILLETMVIASTGWVINYHFSGYYLTDLTFLLLLILVLVTCQIARQLTPPRWYPRFLPIVATAAILINTLVWNSFSPTLPFAAMDRTIGVNMPSIVEAGCDVLVGDYWKIWAPMVAVNDYYYRNHIIDPRTGETRILAVISLRASPIEYLWRPRLEWPGAKLCGLEGDDAEMRSYLAHYAPDRALFLVEGQHFDNVVTYDIKNRHLTGLNLGFDSPVPGEGWSYTEITPTGDSFVWMNATTSTLYLPLATERSLELEFRVIMTMTPDILQSLSLSVNNQPVPLSTVPGEDEQVIFHAILPTSVLASNPNLTKLSFHINRLLIPRQAIPGSIDGRSLGLAFDWLNVK